MVSVGNKSFKKAIFLKLKKKVSQAPSQSGIYLIRDSFNEIIYVGKAKNLRARVRSYIQILGALLKKVEGKDVFSDEFHSEDIKTEVLVQRMSDISFINTSSEVEALLLEAQLIKKHRPRYNIRLKDDKAYPYLRLSLKKEFPKIELSRRVGSEETLYFGPYTQASVLRELIDFLNKTFLIRDCSDHFMKSRKRPCLTHQMGFCEAPCVGWISKMDYRKNIRKALNFLMGKNKGLKVKLGLEMKRASRGEEFEKAARIRDRLRSLENLSSRYQKLTSNQRGFQDVIFILWEREKGILIQFLHIRNFCVVGKNSHFISFFDFTFKRDFLSFSRFHWDQSVSENFVKGAKKSLKSPPLSEFHSQKKKISTELNECVSTYLVQFYEENLIPDRILISEFFDRTHENLLKSFLKLKKKNVSFVSPASKFFNEEDGNIMKSIRLEAERRFKDFSRKLNSNLTALKELKSFFRLLRVPYRIEAFDVSHFSGSNPVASCVVFENGDFKRTEYRHYKLRLHSKKVMGKVKLKTGLLVQNQKGERKKWDQKRGGQDDFSSMKEVLERRFKNKKQDLPDLIVIDGGKGQLSQALQVLKQEKLDRKVFALGMAKARVTKDFKSSRVDVSKERFYVPQKKEFLFLPEDSKALHLMVALRDEAHRFALRLQKKQRQEQLKRK